MHTNTHLLVYLLLVYLYILLVYLDLLHLLHLPEHLLQFLHGQRMDWHSTVLDSMSSGDGR